MHKTTTLILPLNDAEAVLIYQIAKKAGIETLTSDQPHGATIEKTPNLVEILKEKQPEHVVIVEMPGVEFEEQIRALGIDVHIIDHHNYGDVRRASDASGNPLPSSLEQFLSFFEIDDVQLSEWGFVPRRVKAIGIMDRGYCWAMLREGYSWEEIEDAFAYRDELSATIKGMDDESSKLDYAKQVWEKRVAWNGFQIVEDDSQISLRRRVSRVAALELRVPTPLIVVEHGRGFLYVQESPRAMQLLEKLGGFTFGERDNWGYKNETGKPEVTLKQVQEALTA